LTLSALVKDDASLVEASEQQVTSLDALASSVAAQDFEQSGDAAMVAKFASLAAKSDDLVCEGGVSFADLSALLATQFSDSTQRS